MAQDLRVHAKFPTSQKMVKGIASDQLATDAAQAAWKVKKRLLPIFVLVTVANYLDRGNISYAAEGLKQRLGMDDVGYGAASSALFYTYVCFQWPHALIAERVGVRPWLAAMIALWGFATLLTAWVQSAAELVFIRLLIGFAEAGSFPLIYMHLDSYLPAEEVSQSWSVVVASSQIASIISGPLAAALIQLPVNNLVDENWQWLFVAEGLLAVLVSVVVYLFLMDDAPLSTTEQIALANARGNSAHHSAAPAGQTSSRCTVLRGGVADWKAWYLGTVSLLIATPVYAFMFFSPQLIQEILGASASQGLVDVLNGLPYLCASLLMTAAGRSIKFFSERLYHGAVAMLLAALLAFCFPLAYENLSAAAALAQVCVLYGVAAAVYIPLDTMPSAYCSESAESYSILNSIKSISGIIGPPLFGAIKESVDGPAAVAVLGIMEVLGLVMFLLFFLLIGEMRASLSCRELPNVRGEQRKRTYEAQPSESA